jgi:DNA polymerase-1
VELSGYEADDVMGTLARQASARGLATVIVSPDKDLLQLVDDAGGIQVLNNRDGEVWIDRAGVKERFGVWPEQVVDMLTLMGDASDNVKGVDGIGEKGARDLMEQYGTLDAVLAHRGELKRKAHREGLEAFLPRLDLVRRLVTVVTDLTLPLGLDDLAYQGVDQAQARAAFKSQGFEALTKAFTTVGSLTDPAAPAGAAPAAGARVYRAAAGAADLEAAVAECRKAGGFGLDTETTGLDPTRGHMVGLSLAWKPDEGLYVPLAHLKPGSEDTAGSLPGLLPDSGLPEGLLDLRGEPAAFFDELAPYLDPRNVPFRDALRILGPLFLDPAVPKAGQNLKYDLQVLKRHGLEV